MEPNATHWQHPGFLAYFATTASGPGILGEMLTAVLGQNPMLWRTSPIGTELEGSRRRLAAPGARAARQSFDGLLTDTASTLVADRARRSARGGRARRRRRRAGRDAGTGGGLRVYASAEAHIVDREGVHDARAGRAGLRRIPDERSIRDGRRSPGGGDRRGPRGRAATRSPIVATIGTTRSTSVDPVAAIAEVAAREGLWLHVDAAYAGPVALIPERRGPFDGWERADSIVVNPHKWLFTPLDASLLLTRRMDALRAAFSLVPEYLRTWTGRRRSATTTSTSPSSAGGSGRSSCGSCCATFGLDGLRGRIERHLELAAEFAGWVDADPDWERLAPVPFSTVCFRWRRAELAAARRPGAATTRERARHGRGQPDRRGVPVAHAAGGRFTIRLAIGNLRTEERHVERAWDLLRREAARLDADGSAKPRPGTEPRRDLERPDRATPSSVSPG